MTTCRISSVTSYDCSEQIREFLDQALGLDPGLGDFLGSTPSKLVVVKPNWIQHSHEHFPDTWESVITHPKLLLLLLDSLATLMKGRGTITLYDAPHTHADFAAILERGGLREGLRKFAGNWPELVLETIDLRREIWLREKGVIVDRKPKTPDPRGYVRLNLGRESLLFSHKGEGRYYGADYDTTVVNRHHRGEVHEYLISGTPISCDLFVNVPKLKTHKKTGITCCLKNLVGINGDKNWLPHFTEGGPSSGGDEFPSDSLKHSLELRLKRMARMASLQWPKLGTWVFQQVRPAGTQVFGDSHTVIRSGNWHGNDTCWRMALDLNRCLLYGNPDGSWREYPRRKRYLAIVDGIVGGEGNGPVAPDTIESGVLLASLDPGTADATAARLLGFETQDLPIVANAFVPHRWPISSAAAGELKVYDGRIGKSIPLPEVEPLLGTGFRPHFGWLNSPDIEGAGRSPDRR